MTSVLEGFQLSPQQRRLFLQKAERGFPYRAQLVLSLDGVLDVVRLRQAIDEIVEWHEILHTTFQFLPGVVIPLQVIEESSFHNLEWLPEQSWETFSPDEQSARLEVLLKEIWGTLIDFEHGPLLKAMLVKRGTNAYWFILQLPGLYADHATLDNLALELHNVYERLGVGAPREDEPIQHVSMSEWLYDLLGSESAAPGKEYWHKQPPPTSFANTFTAHGALDHELSPTAAYTQPVDAGVAERVERLAAQLGTQPAEIYLACWQVLLWHRSAQTATNIVVGALFNGRADEELQSVIGNFSRTLPVPVTLSPEMTFQEVVAALHARWVDAHSWQDTFVWKAWRGMDEAEDSLPFFPFAFAAEIGVPTYNGHALTMKAIYRHAYTDLFHLKLTYLPTEDNVKVSFAYDNTRLDRALIERMMEEYLTLLRVASENPTHTIPSFSVVGAQERNTLLTTFNQHHAPVLEPACFHTRFEAQVARTPDVLAVLYENSETGHLSTLTFDALNRRANQLARALRAKGANPETFVGLCVDRSVEAIIGVLGILKSGAAYLPLDPDFPSERLTFMLEETGTPIIVSQREVNEKIAAYGVPTFVLEDEVDALAQLSDENLPNLNHPHNVAYAIYTSGSTGRPKGVMVEHASPLALLEGLLDRVYAHRTRPTQRVSLNAPLIFDASMQQLVMLLEGCGLVIIPQSVRLDGTAYIDYLRRHPVDALDCTPSLLQMLVRDGLLDDPVAAPDLILAAGEAIEPWLWQQLQQAPNTTAFNIYGPTEATVDATGYRIADGATSPNIGRPLKHYTLYVLNPQGNPAPIGVSGELYIGGAGVARGYLNRPRQTAERFVPDPFSTEPGARMYRTGDVARWRSNGTLNFMGRIDHQVKIRGYRIELGEIESTFMSHPATQDVVVVVRDDRGDDKRLVGYVVLNGDDSPIAMTRELRNYLHQRLPDYMVPPEIVVLPELPLTASGKVDRAALPAPEDVQSDEFVAAPRTPVEEMLHALWSRVLHIDHLGIYDNFFERGGHSLLAIQLVSGMRETFGLELPLATLFNDPTIAALVQWVENEQREAQGVRLPPLEPAPRDEPLLLSFAQQRLWFLQQIEPTSTMYNMPGVLRMVGKLNVAALEKSIETIINRHETLRTTFAMGDNEQPVQHIHPPSIWQLPIVDIQHLSAEEGQSEVQRWLHDETSQAFNLQEGPLLRVTLLRLAAEEHILIFTLHHIVSDGWSTGVLINEVAALYSAFNQAQPSPLPELSIQYADFAHWQRGWLQGERLERQMDFWKTQLEGAPQLLTFPTDRPRPDIQTFAGSTQSITLSPALVSQLRAMSRDAGVTLFMPLMATFSLLLHHYTDATDIVVGTDVANRTRPEVEGLIGFFINQLVLRTKVTDTMRFSDLLVQVRNVALAAYTHQDLPFDKMVETLNPERSRSYSPLFQAKIVLQNVPMQALELPGVNLTPLDVSSGTAKFDLLLNLWDTEEGLHCDFEYNTDLYNADTIERISTNYVLLLENVVADPTSTLSDLRAQIAAADTAAIEQKAAALREARLQKFQKIKPRHRN